MWRFVFFINTGVLVRSEREKRERKRGKKRFECKKGPVP